MKKKKWIIVIYILCFVLAVIVGFRIQTGVKSKKIIADLEVSNIDRVHFSFYSGGITGSYEEDLSTEQTEKLVELMKKVRFGGRVSEEKAATSGASSCYIIYMKDGTKLTLDPGRFFKINHTYYEFENFDELWDEFIAL